MPPGPSGELYCAPQISPRDEYIWAVNVVVDGLHIREATRSAGMPRRPGAEEHPAVSSSSAYGPIADISCFICDGGGILAEKGANVIITRSSIYRQFCD